MSTTFVGKEGRTLTLLDFSTHAEKKMLELINSQSAFNEGTYSSSQREAMHDVVDILLKEASELDAATPTKQGDEVFIFDDGKRRRPSLGRVVEVVDDEHMRITFKPWGYGEDVLALTLLFKKESADRYTTLSTKIDFKIGESMIVPDDGELYLLDLSFVAPPKDQPWWNNVVRLKEGA
jgi:hypothetical protein